MCKKLTVFIIQMISHRYICFFFKHFFQTCSSSITMFCGIQDKSVPFLDPKTIRIFFHKCVPKRNRLIGPKVLEKTLMVIAGANQRFILERKVSGWAKFRNLSWKLKQSFFSRIIAISPPNRELSWYDIFPISQFLATTRTLPMQLSVDNVRKMKIFPWQILSDRCKHDLSFSDVLVSYSSQI